jgi:hypothetical protein
MDREISWEVREYGHRCKLLHTRRDGKNVTDHVILTIVDDQGVTTTLSRKDVPRNAAMFFNSESTTRPGGCRDFWGKPNLQKCALDQMMIFGPS